MKEPKEMIEIEHEEEFVRSPFSTIRCFAFSRGVVTVASRFSPARFVRGRRTPQPQMRVEAGT